jgi:endoglucanase
LGPDDFARVSQAGFDTIRLPVDWDSHTSRTPPYTIDPAWMDKVAGHVDNGLAWI